MDIVNARKTPFTMSIRFISLPLWAGCAADEEIQESLPSGGEEEKEDDASAGDEEKEMKEEEVKEVEKKGVKREKDEKIT